ncbi:serine/threonine protein kinase [Dyella solisilvae]|uniref:Serine/threonine protein kinase n=1 Tax=Dyella solisilvae TaxID=1920168 RepID=A0A370K8E9_9GAMM|nr:serine/threonine-protein kinase [Dyella solisilvae]RDI98932.1 serine/threonine protein kinase [Dyella solisilvae]
MNDMLPARVQLDGFFYHVTGSHKGGFGRVWLLDRPSNAITGSVYQERLAVKTFEGQDQALVVSELTNWIMLHHPSILPLQKIARLNYRIAAVMERRQGSLQDILDERTLTWSETRTVLIQTCEALHYAQAKHQLAHLDIKPGNIVVDGSPQRIQVADWGISRLVHKGQIDRPNGYTPGFLPPERLKDKPYSGTSSDIFAVGIMAIVCLCGIPPYVYLDQGKWGPFAVQITMQLHNGLYVKRAQEMLQSFAAPISKLVLSCIHPDPSKRYSDYEVLLRDLRGIPS